VYSWQPRSSDAFYVRVRDRAGNLGEPELWRTGGAGGTVVSNGDDFLAGFSDGDNGNGNPNEVWAQRFDSAGAVDGEPFPIVTISRPRGSLSAFGSNYLYAYSGQEIDGTVIGGSSLRLDAEGNVLAEYGPVVDGMLSASRGASDEWVLFSWQDETEALWARLLHADEGYSEPFQLVAGVTEGAPAIAWDGNQFVVVYADDRMAMWTLTGASEGAVSTAERLFDGDYGYPRLTPGPDGQMLLTYIHWGEWSRTRRVESRFLGEGAEMLPPGDDMPPADEPPGNEPQPPEPADTPVADEPEPLMGANPDEPSPDPSDVSFGPIDAADPEDSEGREGDAPVESNDDGTADERTAPAEDETAVQSAMTGASSDGGSCTVAGSPKRNRAHLSWLALGAMLLWTRRTKRDAAAMR
jgi:hypothetical protein